MIKHRDKIKIVKSDRRCKLGYRIIHEGAFLYENGFLVVMLKRYLIEKDGLLYNAMSRHDILINDKHVIAFTPDFKPLF